MNGKIKRHRNPTSTTREKMIIIEGADNSGKSTLACELSSRLNIPLHHSGGPPRNADEILLRQQDIVSSLENSERKIFDRVPVISDMVYGIPLRGGSPFQSNHQTFREQLRNALKFPVIYCRPPVEILLNIVGRDQSHKSAYKTPEHMAALLKKIPHVIERYDLLISNYPHITYDYTGRGSSVTLDQLVTLIRQQLPDMFHQFSDLPGA
jgi:hypothetical protein